MARRALKLAEYIFEHESEHGIAPTLREMADYLNVSLGTASNTINRGVDMGILERRGESKYRAVFAKMTPERIDRKIAELQRLRAYMDRIGNSSISGFGSLI